MDFLLNRKTLFIGALLVSVPVMSSELSYTYLGLGFDSTTVDFDNGDEIDGSTLGVFGSIAVSPNIALVASASTGELDTYQGIDTDMSQYSFGVRAHTPISEGTDIIGDVQLMNIEIEMSDGFSSFSDDDTGTVLGVGIRHMVSEKFELNVRAARTNIFDDTSNSFAIGGRLYNTDKNFSAGVGFVSSDDASTIGFDARLHF